MPSKNTVFLLASLLSTLQFVPLLVTAADPTSSFRTQTLSTKPLPASTLSVVSGGTSNNAVAGRDVVSSGLHNREHHYEHKARDGVPGYLTWVFNNCAKTVSNGYVLDYGPIAGADDGITHMNNLLKANPNKIFTNQAWTGASSDKNCGRIACHDQTNVAVRWCNYNKAAQQVTPTFVIDAIRLLKADKNCSNGTVVMGEAIYYPGITVHVSKADCSKKDPK